MKTLYFDTETTGLIANSAVPLEKQPRIIEFCGLLVDDESGEIIDQVDTLINPGQPISEEIERITGIKQADLVGQPSFFEVSSKIALLFYDCDQAVAHNIAFDWAMMQNECARLGSELIFKPTASKVCTVEGSLHLFGHRLSLTALYQHLFGEAFTGAHRARTDVEALMKCHRRLVELGEL